METARAKDRNTKPRFIGSFAPLEPPPRRFLQTLGPGLITGASDDDPSGIATYSQVGAQYGFSILWTMVFSYPLMSAIQEISARVGRVTGRGIAANLRHHYPRWLLFPIITLLLTANTLNLGADIGAMGAALRLLIGGPASLYAAVFALGSLLLEIFLSYNRYAKILKWLCLALFAYVGVVFAVKVPWGEALHGTFVPHVTFSGEYLTALIAVLGTTISPYLFFWQASAEVEEMHAVPARKAAQANAPGGAEGIRPHPAGYLPGHGGLESHRLFHHADRRRHAARARQDAHRHGGAGGGSLAAHRRARLRSCFSASASSAPGLLAIPVLAGSAAYAISEGLHWRTGLERKPNEAIGFYAVLAVATLLGLAMNFTSMDPIRALFWSAVINGVVAVPVMIVMMLMTTNPKVMGEFTLPGGLRFMGWLATAVMALAAIGLFATWGK